MIQRNSRCKCVDFDSSNRDELYGHFVFTSLERGEGTTIGNLLRRTLLSNLYGFRIVGVRFNGINNEFTQLEGVREDILEIILNLKEVTLVNHESTGQPCFGFLRAQGPGIVTAGCLKFSNNVQVINPNTHLLTISDNSVAELAVKIDHGKSYVFAKDQNLKEFIDFIPIDSNFAPILKVNWYSKLLPQDTENTNGSEELHLEIFTNGTLLPHRALIQARNTIGYMLSPINSMEFPYLEGLESRNTLEEDFKINLRESPDPERRLSLEQVEKEMKNTSANQVDKRESKKISEKPVIKEDDDGFKTEALFEPKATDGKTKLDPTLEEQDNKLFERVNEITDGSLEGLGLSARIIKVLKNSNINSIWDLIAYPASDLISIPGLGTKSVAEINEKLNIFYETSIK